MTTCACTDPGTVWSGTPTGTEIVLTGLNPPMAAYLATPPDGVALQGVVLFITDIFGIFRANPRLWCDRLALKGFAVVAPDFFRGGAFAADTPLTPDAFMPWLARFPRESVMPDAEAAAAYARAAYQGLPVSAAGFCWGGLYVALLAGGDAPLIDAGVMLHPSLLAPADVAAIARPVFVGTNGEDQQVPDAFREEIKLSLASKPFPTATQHWEDMRHGWTLRGDDKDPAIAAAAEEAFERAAGWLGVHGSKS